jgi:ArsR family transcriptional regulator, arsenate/arsenite/antimonite-responsive transcriptional repressor
MEMTTAATTLAALAHESRLRLYRLLVQAGAGGLAVGDLQARSGIAPATLTHHLHALRRAGLIDDTREGRSIVCHADYACMNALLAFLTENCCGGGAACAPATTCRSPNRPARKIR